MVLLDYNQIAIAGIYAFSKDLEKADNDKMRNIIKHVVITSILSNKKKFSPEYGDLVIASDGRNYWRKDHFQYYKANRKTTRDKSDMDWKFIFEVLSEVRDELRDIFPYKVLNIEGCEADDIIAVLCKWTQDNYLDDNVLIQEPKKTIILSSDHDFAQLHRYPNVRQYAPAMKKYIERPKNHLHFVREHIAKGDSGDGIPSVLSPDDCLVNKIRQKSMMKARLEEFLDKGIDACRDDAEIRNWHRNELLVSFDKIPDAISEAILTKFLQPRRSHNKNAVFQYLIKNRMNLLLDQIDDFF